MNNQEIKKQLFKERMIATGVICGMVAATIGGLAIFNNRHDNGLMLSGTTQEWTQATQINYDDHTVELTTYDGEVFIIDANSRIYAGDSVLITFDTNHRWNPKWWDIESVDSIEHSAYKFLEQ